MKFKEYLPFSIVVFFLNSGLILLNVLGLANASTIFFAFFCLALLVLAVKNPRWSFWVFVALLPLENVIVTPQSFPIYLRPYQLAGGILSVVLIFLALAGKRKVALLGFGKICLFCRIFAKNRCRTNGRKDFGYFDRLVFALPIFAFLAVLVAPDRGLAIKGALVLSSFVLLFWLSRNFFQTNRQKLEALWFFSLGAVPVVLFGLYQAVAFSNGWQSLEVFQGRINGTFAEPDWFGMYLAFLFAIELWCLLLLDLSTNATMIGYVRAVTLGKITAYLDLFLISSLILLTVSRSAWVAAAVVLAVYFGANFWFSQLKKEAWKSFFVLLAVVFASFLFVSRSGLSDFHFGNRAVSSVTGMQKITISCKSPNSGVPQNIDEVGQLKMYGCRHIDLEEIGSEKAGGRFVGEVYRPDPNVDVRKKLYGRTWETIKKYPLTGIGVGSSALVLGADEHGSGYNASNIFLEIWISMGIFALACFSFVLFFVPVKLIKNIFDNRKSKNVMRFGSFTMISFGAIVIPNLFNAGLLMGFLWVWLALLVSLTDTSKRKSAS